MSEIKAGIVLKSKFIVPGSKLFANYIDYINRDQAVRNENFNKFSAYQDYMDNPEKTTELFTATHDNLTLEQKQELKKQFETAQTNGSLMWQNVISFDNRWLEEHGIYESKTKTVNESKLKEITRLSMGQMLENENMKSSAVWSASIHFNTDNIHIHIATVEPNPTRETVVVDGKTQYRGKLKPNTLEQMKSKVANNILDRSQHQKEINELIRERIIGSMKKSPSYKDKELKQAFKSIYSKLPADKRMWQYNMNGISHLRGDIDNLSKLYIETYHPKEFKELKERLYKEQAILKSTYGSEGKKRYENYVDNKMKDLYTRMGNTILKEMKEYDKLQQPQKKSLVSSQQKFVNKVNGHNEISRCLQTIKKCLKKDFESIKNQRHHERLLQEIEFENE